MGISIWKMPATYWMVIFDVVLIQSQGLDPLFLLHGISRKAMHRHTLIFDMIIPANNTRIPRHVVKDL